jgi:uncharacterized sulfatase
MLVMAFFSFALSSNAQAKKMKGKRPNIIWIMIENCSYDFGCYGAKGVSTPNIDDFAAQGIRYASSFCTAAVCAPSRSAMMTGFHQLYIGCHQMRNEGPGFVKKPLPYGIKPITQLLEEAGYYTCLMGFQKTDISFIPDKPLFMGKDWKERKPGQPFFAQISFPETDRWYASTRDTINPVDINAIEIPPFYPDLPFTRRDQANYLESVQNADRAIGKLLKRIDDEGLSENTLVFLIADNGICQPRGIQYIYDEGVKVPIIVRWPGYIKPGQVDDHLVTTIDISATILDVAGVDPGYQLHGENLFGKSIKDREYVYFTRDKMDWQFDAMRAIRSKNFKLIHNLMPERAYNQFNEYKETKFPIVAMLNMMYLKGELTPEQAKFMAPTKPEFELYNLDKDPYELYNLADDPKYVDVRKKLLSKLMEWREFVKDPGVSDEFRKGGWPSTYPTRSLEEWTEITRQWEKWLFSGSTDPKKTPKIDYIPGASPIIKK